MGSVEKFFLNGRDPVHGLGRTGWKGQKTLAQGGQGGRSSAKGAGDRARGLTCDLIISLVHKKTEDFCSEVLTDLGLTGERFINKQESRVDLSRLPNGFFFAFIPSGFNAPPI